jgi:hemerythrin
MPSVFIEWGPALELGIPDIDKQHKVLVSLANDLVAELEKSKGGETAKRAVAELFAYSATHFADEEAYLRQYNFPSFDEHQRNHEAFSARAHYFEERLISGAPAETAEILGFIKMWIMKHIGRDDRDLVRIALRTNGAKNPT